MDVIKTPRPIGTGIYLVVDPAMDKLELYDKVDAVLAEAESIAALQIWDHFDKEEDVPALVEGLCKRCHAHNVPVFINNQWPYLADTPLDGVHFDAIPTDFGIVQAAVSRPFRYGITCTNDMASVHWAHAHQADYISFCSMFPSSTTESCEIVTPASVRRARAIYGGPVFLAGGIRPDNVAELRNLRYSGIAVVSGIMGSDSPAEAIRHYQKHISII
ncbi:thiamine phosphate synthase [Parapedobacter sp. 10938]|uniref:thiamine phosphate synthase n=1 Tax=Parapedobacter flavus TaxID=3110225 RepID=UPI002DBAD5E1|nr:thiamine phosphate synthase [Parapedobacter sp. 10938]MEC3880101.1 thiamine phosphate synthase [Parapedobacter sp. 10938]